MATNKYGNWTLDGTLDGITDVQRDDANNKITIVLNKNNSSTRTFTVKYEDNGKCGKKTITQAGSTTPGCDSTIIPIKLKIHNKSSNTIGNFSEIRFVTNAIDSQGRYNAPEGYSGYMRLPGDDDAPVTMPSGVGSVSPGGVSSEISITPSWTLTKYDSTGNIVCSEGRNGLKYLKSDYRPNVAATCAVNAASTGYAYPSAKGAACQTPAGTYAFTALTESGEQILGSQCYGVMLYHDGHTSFDRCLLLENESNNPKTPSNSFTFTENHTYHLYIFDGPNTATGDPGHDINS